MRNIQCLAFVALAALASCSGNTDTNTTAAKESTKKDTTAAKADVPKTTADLATILAQKEVPVLCYHHSGIL